MDALAGLTQGFALLLSPPVLTACIIGLLAGLFVGFLPGISPLGGIALATPFVGAIFATLGPNSPAVFLVALVYGTIYGRALAAMNMNASDPAHVDSRPPNRSAMAGGLVAAVAAAVAVGVFAAGARGTISALLGPTELSGAVAFLLLAGIGFGSGSMASGLAVTMLGLLLAVVGEDIETGLPRLTFGLPALNDGVRMLDLALGLFVIANLIHALACAANARRPAPTTESPARGVADRLILAVLAGVLPTNGLAVADATAERRQRRTVGFFDPATQSDWRGILSAAFASDVRLSVSLMLLLVWFVPGDVVTALLRKIISLQEILTHQTRDRAELIWLVCATLVVVHVVPLRMILFPAGIRWWPIRIDVKIVAPLIVALCCAVAYSATHSLFDIGMMFGFGLLGYGMIVADFDRSLLFFAFLLGPALEENIRRSLLIARGDVTIFATRPISALFLLAGVLLLVAVRVWRRGRRSEREREAGAAATP